ncbi:MAG: hypothetical protein LBU51_08320 [Bacteroidales bacterium]|jgi:hypothetical protein|nr:hypothetical protein [Bacteroidales bacterium]
MNRFNVIFFTIFLLFVTPFVEAQHNLNDSVYQQGDKITDNAGHFSCQYNRIIEKDPENKNKIIVTFVFINGDRHHAITYRQENLLGKIEWLETENGTKKQEGVVESLTAFVPSGHILTWKFRCTGKIATVGKKKTIDIDKSSILIMDDNFTIDKKTFNQKTLSI